MFISDVDEEIMPLWAPPTPPQDDNDVYIDQSLLFLYEPNVMSESQLPPVHIRKEHKKPRIETVTTRKQKQRKEEPPRVPRSLFDRPTAIQQKLRREAKMQKLKGLVKPFRPTAPLMPNKTVMEPPDQDIPEWLINEDWSLLQSVQSLLNLPLNLQVVSPAVTINWDLVADVVNSGSRVYRTPKMCKYQYENVIIPREEGRILYDVSPRKQKKNKGLYKASFQSKNNRPMRTSNLFLQKGNADIKMLYSSRFDLVKAVSNKRTPTLKQTLANPTLRNPKHAAVLEENGITYDQPLNPLQVATNRAERIAREKKQSQAAAQQAAEQLAARTQAAAAAAQAANATVGAAVSAPTIAQAVQAQQLQPLVTGATTVMQSGAVQKLGQNVTAVSIARTISSTGNIIVNTPITSNFATINKTISRAVTVSQPTSIAVTSTQNVRAARPAGTPIELTAIATPQTAQVAGQTRATLQTGATTTLTPQRIATFTGLPTTVQQQLAQAAIAKGLSPQQINMLRQQSIVRHPTPQLRQQKYSLAVSTDQIRQPIKRLPTPLAGQKVITTLQMVQGQKPGLINSDQIKQIQRQQQQQQQQRLLQQKAQGTVGSQGQITVQGTTTQMPTAQIIAQAQVQQVGVTPGTSQTPVVTLVKSTSQSSPVNISVNVGQQKHILTTRAAPFNAQQKMILTQKRTLQQHPQKGTTQLQKAQIPLLMNTSHKLGQHISGQQILQHLVKHQGGSISHIIPQTMIPVSSTGQQTQMITKVSIATTSASSQPITVSASPITVTQVPVSAAQIQAINVSTSQVTPSLIKTSVPQTATMQVRTVPSSVNVTQVKSAALTQSLVSQPIHVQTTPTMQQIQVGIQQAANVTQVPSPAATVQIQHTVPDTHISVASPSLQSAVGAQTVPQPAAVTTIVTSQSQVNQQQQPVKQYGMRTRNNPKS
ncbi:hypothetical protein SNE40_004231 [Patella caerulea]|uniref:Myb-like domain-containing protein n=1 Tax=Patella caerulea TaxID=87958 RepID=A0AAN8K9J3_PATCE